MCDAKVGDVVRLDPNPDTTWNDENRSLLDRPFIVTSKRSDGRILGKPADGGTFIWLGREVVGETLLGGGFIVDKFLTAARKAKQCQIK